MENISHGCQHVTLKYWRDKAAGDTIFSEIHNAASHGIYSCFEDCLKSNFELSRVLSGKRIT
ncbi:MAG TPA: hypothetical protein VN653_10140, partial [Anaerolineales bacterium]|nr:hypothetical protein [Anaerolineales bacterium]